MNTHSEREPAETRPARIAPLARLPVFLALDGKRVVVAGGSPAAVTGRSCQMAPTSRYMGRLSIAFGRGVVTLNLVVMESLVAATSSSMAGSLDLPPGKVRTMLFGGVVNVCVAAFNTVTKTPRFVLAMAVPALNSRWLILGVMVRPATVGRSLMLGATSVTPVVRFACWKLDQMNSG